MGCESYLAISIPYHLITIVIAIFIANSTEGNINGNYILNIVLALLCPQFYLLWKVVIQPIMQSKSE